MNKLEEKMVQLLVDLKTNHNVVATKAEFEDEGAQRDEVVFLRKLAIMAGLDLTIKIGGCGALRDLGEAKAIGANSIVAPMIESAYAAKKFVQTFKTVFSEKEIQQIDFFINIETITGFKNIQEILKLDEINYISGIVLGRADMTGSMGLPRESVNSQEILEIANSLAMSTSKYNKKLIIGGGISGESVPFLKKMPKKYSYNFETRKIIFDIKAIENNPYIGIMKAIEFEILWLKNKSAVFECFNKEHEQRILLLGSLYNKINQKTG